MTKVKNSWKRCKKSESNPIFKMIKAKVFKYKDLKAVINIELDGLMHLSLSSKDRLPTYEEMKKARYDLMPNNMRVAQILPPVEEFVNIHENCLHLWELRENN